MLVKLVVTAWNKPLCDAELVATNSAPMPREAVCELTIDLPGLPDGYALKAVALADDWPGTKDASRYLSAELIEDEEE